MKSVARVPAKKKAPAKKAPAKKTSGTSHDVRATLTAFVDNALAAGGSGEVKLAPPASAKALKRLAKYPPAVRDGLSQVFAGLSKRISCTWDLAQEDKAPALQSKVGFYGDIDLSLSSVHAIDASDFAVKDRYWDDKLSVLETGSGDVIAIDLTPKGAGQVVYLSHDLDRRVHGKVIAPTFAEFVRRWVALGAFPLDGGTFRYFCSPSHRYLDTASPFGRKWLAAVGVANATNASAPQSTARKKTPTRKKAPAGRT